MDERTVDAWRTVGFVVLPVFLDADEFASGVAALPSQFWTADEFHDDIDPARNARLPHGNHPQWHDVVRRATWQQLALFGWPPPSSPFWTDEARQGLAHRYPGLDVSAWA